MKSKSPTELTYAVGDLHGRFDVLEAVLAAIHEHRQETPARVIFVGDLVDRGGGSAQVVDRLRLEQLAQGPLKIIVIKGNHEEMMVGALRREVRLDWWLGNGGDATLASYGIKNLEDIWPLSKQLKADIDWMDRLPLYFETEHQVFVHAGGLVRGVPVADQDEERLLWSRYRGDEDNKHEKFVVHGHTPNVHGPERLPNRMNLDVGGCWNGRAPIAVFNETERQPIGCFEVMVPYDVRYSA